MVGLVHAVSQVDASQHSVTVACVLDRRRQGKGEDDRLAKSNAKKLKSKIYREKERAEEKKKQRNIPRW